MKGDFSNLKFEPFKNYNGVLSQQGRALSDQDSNAANQINSYLREQQGRDAIGAHVAAVPAAARDSFKVVTAETDGTAVSISLHPGRVWVDGLLLQIPGTGAYDRTAEYLAPPIQIPQAEPGSIAAGVRDAVILEVWQDAFNAFQDPLNLIEPALGGVDTTERTKLFHRLRLLRLEPGDECGNLDDKLADDFATKGKLTISAATVNVSGDCPVEIGGGYTGFEHYLMRIEIAKPDADDHARFKWSRFNGGLVGRGTYDSTEKTVTITANDQMINHSGLTSFYLEVLQPDPDGGPWKAVLTADATLSTDGKLSLSAIDGAWPGADEAFFRLWDGIALIEDFPAGAATPATLVPELGIRLEFDAPAAGNTNYTPEDYWTFPLRTAGVDFDPVVWPSNDPPQGIHYHRVPLAILNWDAAPTTTITAPAAIHDCRRVFQPLTQLDSCCTYTVGDGMVSYGDYDSIQEAISNLPPAGGRVCVLPGEYRENILIDKDNISIQGCGSRSRIIADTSAPVFHISGVHRISIHALQIEAHNNSQGILLTEDTGKKPERISLKKLVIRAASHSAIEIRAGRYIDIRNNRLRMQDVTSFWPGIYVIAEDVVIEHNKIIVETSMATGAADDLVTASDGLGGIQIGGTSERVRVIDNLIQGGIGNGITLGTVEEITVDGTEAPEAEGWVVGTLAECGACAPGDLSSSSTNPEGEGPNYQSAGVLYDIRIERNRILNMGLNGIGVVLFFNLEDEDEFISVDGLEILGNTIKHCLTRPIASITEEMTDAMGYGGISLADVENLVIHDNMIEDNGLDHLDPVCGIFILHGEGVDISRNHILNNGAKTPEPSNSAKPGRRGGINVVFAIAPKMPILIGDDVYPRQSGSPAINVHGNIVSQPLGRALSVTALGPVSVEGNQFTSRGAVQELGAPSFVAATVAILNLGFSNEFYLQSLLFSGESTPLPAGADTLTMEDDNVVLAPRAGLDDQNFGQILANGNVMFNDNQCVLDLAGGGSSFTLSSIFIVSPDDIAFHNNQCDCNLDIMGGYDLLLTHTVLFGLSLRVSDNRFKEGLINALLSAITLGLFMNITTDNQATHCLLAVKSPLAGVLNTKRLKNHNQILWDVFMGEQFTCKSLGKKYELASGG